MVLAAEVETAAAKGEGDGGDVVTAEDDGGDDGHCVGVVVRGDEGGVGSDVGGGSVMWCVAMVLAAEVETAAAKGEGDGGDVVTAGDDGGDDGHCVGVVVQGVVAVWWLV
nr:hypothetical protein [Tanacetum cinerariifolium]